MRLIKWEEQPELAERWQEVKDLKDAIKTGDITTATRIIKSRPALLRGPDFDYEYHYNEHAGWSPIAAAALNGQTAMLQALLDLGANPIPFEVGGRYHSDNRLQWLDNLRERGRNDAADILAAAIQQRYGPFVDAEDIHSAVCSGDIDRVQKLLDADPDRVRHIDSIANTPLHWAVDINNLDIVRLLLERGAQIEFRRGDGRTPAQIAVFGMHMYWRREERPEIIQYLLNHGAEHTCLIAAATKNIDRVRECLREDPLSAREIDIIGLRPLNVASWKRRNGDIGSDADQIEIVRLLLEAGADPNARELLYQGGGALHAAASYGNLELARILLEAGANPVHWMDSSGDPMIIAEHGGHTAMKQLLYSYGATAEIQHYASRYQIDVIAEVLRRDPSIAASVLPHQWQEPWDKPEIAHDIISLALRYGARFEDLGGWKLGHLVISYPNVAKLVFEYGGRPDVALTQIAPGFKTATVETLRFLIEECGANIEAKHHDGYTPLAAAAFGGRMDFVEYLLDQGANIDPDVPGWLKPIRLAEKRGHTDIAEFLRQRGAK